MSYALSMSGESDYLFVQATGVRTPDSIPAMAKDIVSACDEQGYSRVLVDVQGMTGKLDTLESYEFASQRLEGFGRPGRLKAAVVDREENRERLRFVENVARNRYYNIRIFSDRDEAVSWLTG